MVKRNKVPDIEIQRLIKSGAPVAYPNVIIGNGFDLSLTELQKEPVDRSEVRNKVNVEGMGLENEVKIVASEITISHSIIEGEVVFRNTKFLKQIKFEDVIFNGNLDLRGAIFNEFVSFNNCTFNYVAAEFGHVSFNGIADFNNTKFYNRTIRFDAMVVFGREAWFNNSVFLGVVQFQNVTFKNEAAFGGAKFCGEASFNGAIFEDYTDFGKSLFNDDVDFKNAVFLDDDSGVRFAEACFNGKTDFRKVNFSSKYASFRSAKFTGECASFKDAKFKNLPNQEEACRKAKKVLESSGHRNHADDHYYLEMMAKRRKKGTTAVTNAAILDPGSVYEMFSILYNDLKLHSKGQFIRHDLWNFIRYNFIEYICFQNIFGGYGVYPKWIIIWWVVIAGIFAAIYYYILPAFYDASCAWQCIHVSFLIAFTKGYGAYHPKPGIYEGVAEVEIVLGLAMFGLFIASITRKYMR